MAGNKKHGYARGSRSGRNGAEYWYFTKPWHCDGCKKMHAAKTERVGYEGGLYCNKQYYKLKEKEFTAQKSFNFAI